MIKAEQIYISTIAEDASPVARQHGFGLEIAEYCTAYNMDEQYTATNSAVRDKLRGVENRIFHAPFNELFPCAIDPMARKLAAYRFRQAIRIARQYGAKKLVIHGGYNPKNYYPIWYVEQSILFWKDFMKERSGIEIVLENVLEEKPELLLTIVQEVNDPHLKLCLDIGHVNTYSEISAEEWLRDCSPYLSHFHLHNNDGTGDTHSALNKGTIPVEQLLCLAEQLCTVATYTLEVTNAASSAEWLLSKNIIQT